ncbi:MAG: nucleotidyltransferase [Candidatus Krumholzibacteria bacterium]|nr:nucleotidyltransferase [Candidatus Krumholzibacteria bacterium]
MAIDTRKTKQLAEILHHIGNELDIPEGVYATARQKYLVLAEWLKADHQNRFSSNAEIYHQGSFRLGTAIRPVKKDDKYDVDLVYRRNIKKDSTSQDKLKAELGEQLERYIMHLHDCGESIPQLVPRRRCWTLDYKGQFHMDVLPAIPDDEADQYNLRDFADGIKIPDRKLHEWQHSNPKGYAGWFNDLQKALLLERREMMAKAAEIDVEKIPVERVHTPLRRVVQILKRHRDICYQENPGDKPISIIITTLAGKAYNGEVDIYEALMAVTSKMRDKIHQKDGEWWVPNPINPKENFADKWKKTEEPQRADRFFEWLKKVEADFTSAGTRTGIDRIVEIFSSAFGSDLVKRATEKYGRVMDSRQQKGELWMAAKTGVLGAAGTIVRKNTWYGA